MYDDVLYEHGEGGQAQMKAKNNMMSSVCGHTHPGAYVQWCVGKRFRVCVMLSASGLALTSSATAYATTRNQRHIGVRAAL